MSAVREKNVAKIQSTYVKQQEIAEIASARKKKLLMRRLGLFTVLAAFVSYFMISHILAQAAVLQEKSAEQKQLVKQLSVLKKKQEILKENIVQLNDDDYIAKLARKDYFFSDKNEIIFNIPENKKEK
jgi:cell division protein DivIC